jgi:hypothetical protein
VRQRRRSGEYTGYVWLSFGISQVMWKPDGSAHAGTEPLRWKSTAFAADYQAATVRYYHDDPRRRRSAWDDATYRRSRPWLSIGGWFEPFPWRNRAQRHYVEQVRRLLDERPWAVPGF